MKAFCAIAAVGLLGSSLLGLTGIASAQPYGGRDYGYGNRDEGYRDRGYRDRDDRNRDYDDRDGYSRGRDGEYGRGGRGGGRDSAFNEREYLRCNPDVSQALRSGQITSAAAHYQKFGRREGRRLSC